MKYGITEQLDPYTADWLNRLHAVLLRKALLVQRRGGQEALYRWRARLGLEHGLPVGDPPVSRETPPPA